MELTGFASKDCYMLDKVFKITTCVSSLTSCGEGFKMVIFCNIYFINRTCNIRFFVYKANFFL